MFAQRDDVRVPEIVWEHTTRRVLTMEFMEGIKITDVEALDAAGVDPQRVVQLLVDAYAVQVFQHGFFHADPHPGNLLVQPEGPRLVMLDFGLSKELPPTFREGVVRFAGAMIQEDAEGMVQAFLDLGFETRDGSGDSLVEVARFALEFARRVRERTSGDPRIFERWNQELPELVRQNPVVRIPSHVVLMGRALGLLSGVSRSLGARIDLLRAVLPYVMGATPTPAP
jgi:predicted unusual protein kinase regulating ubiquinone biosynthesis (AarF/ABC1/UbiB family)